MNMDALCPAHTGALSLVPAHRGAARAGGVLFLASEPYEAGTDCSSPQQFTVFIHLCVQINTSHLHVLIISTPEIGGAFSMF